MRLEDFLKKNLGFEKVSGTNYRRGGDISQGQSFLVDGYQKIFVKQNSEQVVRRGLNFHKIF